MRERRPDILNVRELTFARLVWRSFGAELFSARTANIADMMRKIVSACGSNSGILLDLGCGDGSLGKILSRNVSLQMAVGIDVLHRKEFKKGGPVCFVVGDAIRLPFQESFTCITCVSLIEHIREGLREQLYASIKSVLKKEGLLLIQVPNRYFIVDSHTLLPMIGYLPGSIQARFNSLWVDGYCSIPSLQTIIQQISQNSFRVLSIERLSLPLSKTSRLARLLAFVLNRICPTGFVITAVRT